MKRVIVSSCEPDTCFSLISLVSVTIGRAEGEYAR